MRYDATLSDIRQYAQRRKTISTPIAALLATIVLTACSDGDTPTAGDAIEVELPAVSQAYSGPGSVWTADLASDGNFAITRRATSADPVDLTVNGSYERLASGFVKLVVGSANGQGAPDAGSQAWGLEIQGYTLLLKPVGGDNQVIPMLSAGTCPTADFSANWVTVRQSSSRDATDPSRDFWGTFVYQAASGTATLPSRFALTSGYPNQGNNTLSGGSCDNGVVSIDDAQMFLTANGGAIVNTNVDDPQDTSFIFALQQRAVGTLANTDGSYAGMLFAATGQGGGQIEPIQVSCVNGQCSGAVVTDIETGALSTETVSINFDSGVDGFGAGLITGQITQGTGSGHLACMADVNAQGRGDKMISCVGQSPGDQTRIFNIVLVNRATVSAAVTDTIMADLQLIDGDDVLGLSGSSFAYRVTPSNDVVRFQTLSSGAESTVYGLGSRSLTISGSGGADGTYPMLSAHQNSSYLDADTLDRMGLGGTAFRVGDYRIMVPPIVINLNPDASTGSGQDPLPMLSASDATAILVGGYAGVYGLQVWSDTRRIARYQLANRVFGGL